MPRRQIKDEHGSFWDVWDVKPGDAATHASYDRRNGARADDAADAPDASVDRDPPMLSSELEHGWLCFQSGSARRRFAPIPPNWPELPDGVLRVMLDVATPVNTPPQGTQPTTTGPRSSAAE